jgi:hypothetical protein
MDQVSEKGNYRKTIILDFATVLADLSNVEEEDLSTVDRRLKERLQRSQDDVAALVQLFNFLDEVNDRQKNQVATNLEVFVGLIDVLEAEQHVDVFLKRLVSLEFQMQLKFYHNPDRDHVREVPLNRVQD